MTTPNIIVQKELTAEDAKQLVSLAKSFYNPTIEKCVEKILEQIKKESSEGKSYVFVDNIVCIEVRSIFIRYVYSLRDNFIQMKVIKRLRNLGYQVSYIGFLPFSHVVLLVSWY